VRLIGEDIHLRFVPEPEIWTVQVDSAQVEQVLLNLVVNSRDAMPKGGLLTIETANVRLDDAYVRGHYGTKVGDYALLAVSDNGIGMDKETVAHVFEPFFTTKPLGKGTGLGLATSYGIVDQAGGFINVYSEPGRGTTFKLYLPRALARQPQSPKPAEPSVEIRGGVVLVVEDEELVRRATTETLVALGYRVLQASDATQAIEMCEKDEPLIDVVLTDVVMPGMNGRELQERLQKLRPGLRILFTSGYTANVMAHHGILESGICFIPKPFGMAELARKLRDVLAAS
jgi:CheY-like chemotaxis protein